MGFEQVASIQAGLTSATQQLSGDSLGASLTQSDAAAAQQQEQLTDALTGLFGDAYKASAAYASQMDQLTANLAEQRADLILQQQEQQQSSIDGVNSTLAGIQADTGKSYASIAQAGGTLAGAQWANSENESADLFTFDYQAKVQQDSPSQQLISTYGQSYTTTAAYAQDMASLEDSLAAQRLAIQVEYTQQSVDLADSANQAASSVIGNLSSFITSLESGSASPLNAQSQYGLAQQNYETDLAGAQTGDATSLTNLQGYASAYLSASQNLYGSGAGYANDYTAVLQALNGIASTSQDTLTASFYAAQVQNQTGILAANQASLLAASNNILAELRQQNARPVAA